MNVIRRHCGGIEAVHKFIAAVKSYPSIWVHSGGKLEDDSANGADSFEEIIKKLGWEDRVSVENARSAWTHLRMQYSKEKTNRSECKADHSDHSEYIPPAWEFFDDMNFVDNAEIKTVIDEDGDSTQKIDIMSCAIWHCPSTTNSMIDGRPMAFFDAPSESNKDLWKKWERAVPALSSASSNQNLKVCELHFVKGAPSEDSPVPVLRLHNEANGEARISRKRKASRSPSPGDKKNTESLDSVLQAVTDSAIKREMELLGETDATQPLKLPSTNTTSHTVAHSTSVSKPRIVRLSMKALGSLSGGKFSTNYKLVRAPNGVAGLGAETSKFIVDGKGGKTKVFKVIKAPAGVSSVLKKPASPESNVPKTKSIEETLSSLVASAPTVSEVDGIGIDQLEKADTDVHSDGPSTSGETNSAEVVKLADTVKTNNDEESANPSTSISHKQSDSAENQPVTLMSVLQQCLGPGSDLKDAEPSQVNELFSGVSSVGSAEPTGPRITCQKCANDLPALRRSLGRLESRVDSMITMVRTLCSRQASIEASRKQILSDPNNAYKTPSVVVRPRPISIATPVVTMKGATSQQRSTITVSSNGTASANQTTAIVNQCGRMATLVRVKSGSGSTFKLVRASPKLALGTRMQKPIAVENITQSATKLQAVGNEPIKSFNVSSAVLKRNATLDSDSNRPSLKAVEPKQERESRDSSPDCAPPSLSTRFTPAPKQPDRSLTYLHKAVIRSLLLFQGPFFTIADFRIKGPAVVRTVGEDKLRECLAKLLDDGLLRRIDDHLDLTDPEAAFEKERLKSKLIRLSDYGITKEQYVNSLQQILEKDELLMKR